MKIGKQIILAAIGVLFTGCVTPNQAQIGPYPADYIAIMREHIRRSYFDPYSLQDIAMTSPTQGHMFFQQGWIVCLEANGKNRMGGYTGLQRTAFLINNGVVVNAMERAQMCAANTLYYAKIPDLMTSK